MIQEIGNMIVGVSLWLWACITVVIDRLTGDGL